MEEVYQKINELAEAIKDSQQLLSLRESKHRIESDDEQSDLLERYMQKQYEVQKKQFLNQDVSDDMVSDLTTLYQQIQLKPDIMEFLDTQYIFVQMWADLQRIVGDVIGDLFESDDRMLN